MNPVLVKPEADTRSQVVVLGQADHELSRLPWRERRRHLWPVVRESLHGLMADYDVVVIEGAGSPAEVNLRDGDIVNMAVALEVAAPVLLCCDIDRGGAFAHLLGTWHCLAQAERDLLAGFLLNRFRGDPALLAPGPEWLEERTGVPTLGVIPWLDVPLPEEDGVALQGAGGGDGRIAIVALPRIANLDEFAPLGTHARFVHTPAELEMAAAIVIPGTKATLSDLEWLRSTGLAGAIARRAAAGVPVLGVCGGLQMLGRTVRDPLGVEGGGAAPGLGLLDLETELQGDKTTRLVHVTDSETGAQLDGYEIHHGATAAGATATPTLTGRKARSAGAPATCARATCTGCWSTRPTATPCSPAPGSSPQPRPRASMRACRRSPRRSGPPSTGRASAASSSAPPPPPAARAGEGGPAARTTRAACGRGSRRGARGRCRER